MPIEIKMPALSPTMEQGKLARWLVKEGDEVRSGDILAEIETDKATMEFEAVDEGTITSLAVPEGSEGVKVGTVIATIAGEDENEEEAHPRPLPQAGGEKDASAAEAKNPAEKSDSTARPPEEGTGGVQPEAPDADAQVATSRAASQPTDAESAASEQRGEISVSPPATNKSDRVIASPLAKRIAADKGVDLAALTGTGPNGRIVKSDVEGAGPASAKLAAQQKPASRPPAAKSEPEAPAPAAKPAPVAMADETRALLDTRVPHTVEKLSGMRKTIARRLAQSMSQAPHIYLTVDIRLDRLMAMRAEINAALAKPRGDQPAVKLSVNDLLIKALGKALIDVPECNVTFAGNELIRYSRADISVAVSIPGGLITPIVQEADSRSLSSIATAMKDLGERAKVGKLTPEEYQGGTASISNMGMMGIKQFTAVINPPQSTILAIGAGEKRPWVMADGALGVATAMSATGSFDHRAVDGADGARLMTAFREYVEAPLGMVA